MEITYITAIGFWFTVATQSLQPCPDVYATGCYWDKDTMDTALSYIVDSGGGLQYVADPERRVDGARRGGVND